jgi:hypothetical protein
MKKTDDLKAVFGTAARAFTLILAASALLTFAGCKKERKFVLEEFKDYTAYSTVPFKSTDYSNTWLLPDASQYKTVLKELQQIFGVLYGSSTMKNGPKPHEAKIGIFRDEDNDIIILEIGSDVKGGGGLWNWAIPHSGFEEGKYALKMRLSDGEYIIAKQLGL